MMELRGEILAQMEQLLAKENTSWINDDIDLEEFLDNFKIDKISTSPKGLTFKKLAKLIGSHLRIDNV